MTLFLYLKWVPNKEAYFFVCIVCISYWVNTKIYFIIAVFYKYLLLLMLLRVLIYFALYLMLFKGTHWLCLQINGSVFLITYCCGLLFWGCYVLCLSNHLINPSWTFMITKSVIQSKDEKSVLPARSDSIERLNYGLYRIGFCIGLGSGSDRNWCFHIGIGSEVKNLDRSIPSHHH